MTAPPSMEYSLQGTRDSNTFNAWLRLFSQARKRMIQLTR